MRATVYKAEKRDFAWLIILILMALPIILELLAGEAIYNKSYKSIISAQKFMSNNFGLQLYKNIDVNVTQKLSSFNIEPKMDYLYSFLEEKNSIEKVSSKEIFTSELIHLINSNSFYLIICAILFNFVNIYKVFILSMTLFSANFISATLSYIFHSPKPYMVYYQIKSAVVFNEWGSPNNQIVVLISFGLSLYQVLTKNRNMEKKLWAKILLIIFLVIYSFIDIFLLFASGNCTYNHIIISLFMAVSIYFIIFHSFKVDLNKSKQFYDFIKFNTIYYLVINLLLFIFQLLLSSFIIDDRDIKFYGDNGKIQIGLMPSNNFSNTFCKYRNKFFLNSGNLCNIFCSLMNIIAFLSLKADLHFNYKDNYNSWSEGNFEKSNLEILNVMNADQSAQGEYVHIDNSQWNHNGVFRGTIRFLFLLLFVFGIFFIFILASSWADNETYELIFLIIVPMCVNVLGIFFLYKYLFIKFKLARSPKIKTKKLVY